LRQLTDALRERAPLIRAALEAAAYLETVFAKARYAVSAKAFLPSISKNLSLRGARHPLLLKKLGRERTVPLRIELDETRRVLVLTGPNAGGKTVLLKTVGMLSLMMQSGLAVPAEEKSELPIVDGVFVKIGDSQSIAD